MSNQHKPFKDGYKPANEGYSPSQRGYKPKDNVEGGHKPEKQESKPQKSPPKKT